jgi:hypothetical protein
MLYIKIVDENKSIIDKLFCLVNGIILAIERKSKVVIFDDSTNMIINILDMDLTNKYLKNKFDIIIADIHHNYNFDSVNYGTTNFSIDLTEEIITSFIKDDTLFIPKNIILNTIKGDPITNIVKNLYIKYYINKISITETYEEHRTYDIIINNKNPVYIQINKDIDNNKDIFNNIIVNLQFKNIFQEKINILDNEINKNNKKINVISLVPSLFHEELNKEDIYNKYICIIKKYIDIEDFNIILSESVSNTVIDFLTNNNYNYIVIEKFFEEQENNEIINLLSTRYCNKLYLGFYDPDNTNSYNFTYYTSELSDKEVLKICFNPKNLDNDENIF